MSELGNAVYRCVGLSTVDIFRVCCQVATEVWVPVVYGLRQWGSDSIHKHARSRLNMTH